MSRRKEEGGRRKGVGVGAFVLVSLVLLSPSSFLLSQDRALPDFETLYKTTRENLAEAERVAHLYAFKERRTDLHTNPFGKVGTDGTRVFEVYPSANPQLTYRRLIERNDKPLPPDEIAEQDRDYRVRVAEIQRRIARRSDEERRRREEDAARARRRGQAAIEDIIDTLQFKLEGRTVHEGVQAIVVRFTPKPNANPRTRQGRIAQKFAGTVWIHEEASEVMRVEARAIDDLSFGLGIVARLDEGATATLVRRPVERGVWMPTELTLSGQGRAAMIRRLVIDYVLEWFDYRRLAGTSATPFLDAVDSRR
jgi:hypothetical protein